MIDAKLNGHARKSGAPFHVVGYSRPGRDHIFGDLRGNGNQDCYGYRQVPLGLVAVTCDGCGSESDSSTGARAAVRIVLNTCEELLERDDICDPHEFAEVLQRELLSRIWSAARPLCKDRDVTPVILDSYLFTLLVAVVTPCWTALLGCGDGYHAINGTLEYSHPRANNQPEYLAYRLCKPVPDGFQDVQLHVLQTVDTEDCESVLVASDGLGRLRRERQTSLGPFSIRRLWEDKRFFTDPSTVKNAFEELGEDRTTLATKRLNGEIRVFLDASQGIFHDDVTFVVLVRNESVSLPSAWTDYRSLRLPEPTPESASMANPENENTERPIEPAHLAEDTAATAATTALEQNQAKRERHPRNGTNGQTGKNAQTKRSWFRRFVKWLIPLESQDESDEPNHASQK